MTGRAVIGGLEVRHGVDLDAPTLTLLRAANVGVISTHAPGGRIRTRVVWVDTDGVHVILNSVGDRGWVRDLDRNPSVTCTIVHGDDPYRFASIEGCAVERTTDGADAHIDDLARKYLGVDTYPFHHPDEPRLILRIRPDRILAMAPEAAELGSRD